MDLEAVVKRNGWTLSEPGAAVDASAHDELFVIAAVPWSDWDRRAAGALARYGSTRRVSVVVFNLDLEPPEGISERRFPSSSATILQAPVVARYVSGQFDRLLQGLEAAEWLEGLPK